jgi:hypothetical protein
VLVAKRNYTVVQSNENDLTIMPRERIFDGTPVAGCTDDDQCMTIQETLDTDSETRNAVAHGTIPRYKLTCGRDDTRGGPNRCIETCTTSADCEAGTVCQDGICYMGVVPPSECYQSLQDFELDGGDSFVVLTANAGYRGRMKEDTDGSCVYDTSLNPLVVGRFHRVEPDCTDTTVSSITPNPCHETLQEPLLGGDAGITTRDSYAIHFRTPGLAFDVADVAITVPGMTDQLYTPVSQGYGFSFVIGGGFLPYALQIGAQLPTRIVTGPDGSLWIVDSGESTAGPQGQVINAGISDGVRATLY